MLCMQLDTHPHGTIKLILSDDFSNTSFQAGDLEYCQGKVPCKFLDPWDLNWPSGEQIRQPAIYLHQEGFICLSVCLSVCARSGLADMFSDCQCLIVLKTKNVMQLVINMLNQ